jgi:leucine-rich repeat-containing G protein-coupled receptor 8
MKRNILKQHQLVKYIFQLQWVDGRPLSYTSWNNALSDGQKPFEISTTFDYIRFSGHYIETIKHEHVSDFLLQSASSVLQPAVVNISRCGYLLLTTPYSPVYWLMGPCTEKTNPGAFICSTGVNNTHRQAISEGEIHIAFDTITAAVSCKAGWTLLGDKCFTLQDKADTCLEPVPFSHTQQVQGWVSHYLAYEDFHCQTITYKLSNGDVMVLHSESAADDKQACFVCASDAQAVVSCPDGLFRCIDGSCISPAAICDGKMDCFQGEDELQCNTTVCHIYSSYQDQKFCLTECQLAKHDCVCGLDFWQCVSGGCIAISKLCDGQQDCEDESDELECKREGCNGAVKCRNQQCVDKHLVFDRRRNCLDNSDENYTQPLYNGAIEFQCGGIQLPDIRVNDLIPDCVNGEDEVLYKEITMGEMGSKHHLCPEKHLPCIQHHPRCFPEQKLCMFELDMDEQMMHCRNGYHVRNCEDFPCHQSFKCAASYCIPTHYICDGTWHCPDGDDEEFCEVGITQVCTASDIRTPVPPFVQHSLQHSLQSFEEDGCIPAIIPVYSRSSMSNLLSCPGLFRCQFGQCVHPSLLCDGVIHCPLFADDETNCVVHNCPAKCTCMGKSVHCINSNHTDIPRLPSDTLAFLFKQSRSIREITSLNAYSKLLKLHISFCGVELFASTALHQVTELTDLDVSHNRLQRPPLVDTAHSLIYMNLSNNVIRLLPPALFQHNHALRFLDLSWNELEYLQSEIFGSITTMSFISLVGNHIVTFEASLLHYFQHINMLQSDSHQHCCLARTFHICSPATDGFSTCQALLAEPAIKATVYLVGTIGLTANSYVIVNRIKYKKAHSFLIVKLAFSDVAYSVYMLIIGMADVYYSGAYILYDDWWRNSFVCKSMSFVAMFSGELSIMILVCITIERFINIYNISRMKLSLLHRLPVVMVTLAWATSLILLLIPLLLTWWHEESFASTNSIFGFLDLSSKHSAYKTVFLLCVYVVVNGLCFLTILILYALIINLHIESSKKVGRGANVNLFKRTFLIVLSNFLCWAPVAGFVLFSFVNALSSSRAAVWMAILVLPINSAANPAIYTLSAMCKSK